MRPTALIVLGLVSCGAMTGCKIVYDTPESETAIPADASGDDARTALRITPASRC